MKNKKNKKINNVSTCIVMNNMAYKRNEQKNSVSIVMNKMAYTRNKHEKYTIAYLSNE